MSKHATDVYNYLATKAKADCAQVSVNELVTNINVTKRKIHTQLKNLIRDGYVEVIRGKERDGGPSINKYTITNKIMPLQIDVIRAKVAYIKLVAERLGKHVSQTLAFVGYANSFVRIADICNENKFDTTLYIVACFHSFSVGWCNKTFKRPYPPPTLLSNKKYARERMSSFLRFVEQHAPQKVEAMSYENYIIQEFETWIRLGSPRNLETLTALQNANILSKPVVAVVLNKPMLAGATHTAQNEYAIALKAYNERFNN